MSWCVLRLNSQWTDTRVEGALASFLQALDEAADLPLLDVLVLTVVYARHCAQPCAKVRSLDLLKFPSRSSAARRGSEAHCPPARGRALQPTNTRALSTWQQALGWDEQAIHLLLLHSGNTLQH